MAEPLRVGVLTTSFPRFEGDLAGNFVYLSCRALRSRGAEVAVVAPHTEGAAEREDRCGMAVERFRYLYPASLQKVAYDSGTPANLRRSWLARLGLPLFLLVFWVRARRLARRSDVLHTHWIPAGLIGLAARPLLGRRRLPVVVSVWGSDLALLRAPVFGRIVAYVLRRAGTVIAVSETMKRDLVASGLREEKVAVVLSAVSPLARPEEASSDLRRRLRLPAAHPVVLFLGRLSPVKGPDHLVEAAKLVLAEAPETFFALVGDGQLRPGLEAATRAHGIDGSVLFAGFVPHDQVGDWLAAADLLALPSLSEGLPHAVLESMAFGLPVVASAVGGVPEVVRDGVTGYVVPAGDPRALAARILSLVRDPARRRAMGEAGRRSFEERDFTWGRVGRDFLGVYRGLLAQG